MAKSNAEIEQSRQGGVPPPIGVFAVEISPDVFAASAAAIRLWLQGELSEQIEYITYDFEPIRIKSTVAADKALAVIGLQGDIVAAPKLSPRRVKKKRGRKLPGPETEALENRIYNAWSTRSYVTYEDCALALGEDVAAVGKVIQRVARRRSRATELKRDSE
jgi:hypothetical protein